MRVSMLVAVAAFAIGPAALQAQSRSVGNIDTPFLGAGKLTDPDKVVCVTQIDTGSRLGGTKTCHTKAEWAQLKQAQRSNGNNAMDAGRYEGCVPPLRC